MKRRIGKAAALLLSAALLMQTAAALGTEQFSSSVPIGEGIELHETVFEHDGRQDEHYITYVPNTNVVPVMVYGSKVTNYGRFDSMAALVENTGRNVIGGVNGDFYGVDNYQPVGIVVSDGVIRCSDGGYNAVGFKRDGTVIMGRPGLKGYLRMGGLDYELAGINTGLWNDAYVLYSEDYAPATRFTSPTVNVILSIPGDYKLRFNSYVDLKVESIVETREQITLEPGKLVLSFTQASDSSFREPIKKLKEGDTVPLILKGDTRWNDVQHAVGGLYRLLDNGVIQPEIDDNQRAPRTALGVRPDGTLVMYTVDGRQTGYSSGMYVPDVARRLLDLGCVDACLMDGGGSTNLHVRYIGDDSSSQVNQPCYGERSVTNFIMLAATGEGSGELRAAAVYPVDPIILSGAQVAFRMGGADEAGNPVTLPEDPVWRLEGPGAVDEEGLYTASAAGEASLQGTVGGLSDTAKILVVETPDSISLTQEGSDRGVGSLTLYNGEQVQLKAACTYLGCKVLSTPEAFDWQADEIIGSIDETGLFTAGIHSGRGSITVAAGDTVKTVDVTVKSRYLETESFESYLPAAEGMEQETVKDYVRFGHRSLQLNFSGEEADTFYSYSAALDPMAAFLSLWVRGDGSSAELSIVLGNGSEIPLTTLSSTAWQQVVVPLEDWLSGRQEIAGFRVSGSAAASCWIDQIVSSTGADTDLEPPTVIPLYEEDEVRAMISDDRDERFAREQISVSYDGFDIEFGWEAETGRVRVPARSLEPGHRVSITARDQSGNLTTSALWLPEPPPEPEEAEPEQPPETEEEPAVPEEPTEPEEPAEPDPFLPEDDPFLPHDEPEEPTEPTEPAEPEPPVPDAGSFTDMKGHWAEREVRYMAGQGVVNGMGDGTFAPNSPVTRAQCAVMVARWLRLDLTVDEDVELPFADAASIPSWALDAVKAVYSRGIITGKQEADGVYFAPSDPLSREQAMTIIGRIQPLGYYRAELSSFADAGRVQSWSRTYLQELVGRGVINGYEDNTLRPAAPVTRAQLATILTKVR